MPSSRFYDPRGAKLTKREKAFIGDQTKKSGFTIIAEGMETRRIGVMEPGEYQISYSFPIAVRPHRHRLKSGKLGQYGAKGMTYRLLYEYLCEKHNDGVYFIDTYFQSIFPSRSVYSLFADLVDEVTSEVDKETAELYERSPRKKDGTPDMRRTVNRPFYNLKVWQDAIRKARASRVAEELKDDIIRCLANGIIPLRKAQVTAKTKKVRERFPSMDPSTFFYASGSLIKSIQLYVELGRRK